MNQRKLKKVNIKKLKKIVKNVQRLEAKVEKKAPKPQKAKVYELIPMEIIAKTQQHLLETQKALSRHLEWHLEERAK